MTDLVDSIHCTPSAEKDERAEGESKAVDALFETCGELRVLIDNLTKRIKATEELIKRNKLNIDGLARVVDDLNK